MSGVNDGVSVAGDNECATLFMQSTDGGLTWQKSDGVRVIHKEVWEDDDSLFDLHLNVTSEGVIIDLVCQADGEVKKTTCLLLDDLAEMAH